WVILGANAIARALARCLREAGHDVLCIDTDPALAQRAEQEGIRILYGNGLEELTLRRAEAGSRAGFVALTPNEEVNLLFAQHVRAFNKNAPVLVALDALSEGITPDMVYAEGARVLFGASYRTARWVQRFERGEVQLETWRAGPEVAERDAGLPDEERRAEGDELLPMVIQRRGDVAPVADRQRILEADQVTFAVHRSRAEQATARLKNWGFCRTD